MHSVELSSVSPLTPYGSRPASPASAFSNIQNIEISDRETAPAVQQNQDSMRDCRRIHSCNTLGKIGLVVLASGIGGLIGAAVGTGYASVAYPLSTLSQGQQFHSRVMGTAGAVAALSAGIYFVLRGGERSPNTQQPPAQANTNHIV